MNEFYEFGKRSYQRKGGLEIHCCSTNFLLLGAVVIYISTYIQDSNKCAGKNIGQEDKTTIEKDVDEDESNKLPSLGARDLFITSDNPVLKFQKK